MSEVYTSYAIFEGWRNLVDKEATHMWKKINTFSLEGPEKKTNSEIYNLRHSSSQSSILRCNLGAQVFLAWPLIPQPRVSSLILTLTYQHVKKISLNVCMCMHMCTYVLSSFTFICLTRLYISKNKGWLYISYSPMYAQHFTLSKYSICIWWVNE